MNTRKILLTGGCGFIGSHFIKRAIELGHSIVNVDKLTYAGRLENVTAFENHPQYRFYKADICDFDTIKQVFEKEQPDTVVHMAAETHVDRSIDSGAAFVQANVVGTFQMLQAALMHYNTLSEAQKAHFRFLHLSTDEVFGALTPDEDKFRETSKYNPSSSYSAAKASSDLFVKAFYKTYGLPTIVVNSANNYGPGQFPEKLIPVMILNAIAQRPLPVYGDGQQIRDWLFVDDNVEALLKLLDGGKLGESYCISGEDEWANLTIVNRICDVLDTIKPLRSGSHKALITYVQDRPGHDRRYAVHTEKLRSTIDWAPQYPIEKGLRLTVEWYLKNVDAMNDLFDRHRMGLGR